MTGSGDGASNSAGDRGPAEVPSPGPAPRPGSGDEAGHEGFPGDLDADGGDRSGLVRLASSRGRLLLTTVVLGSAIASLTSTVANIALPAMARDLGVASSGQKWIVNAFGITLAALIPVGGTLGDRFGRVRVYRIGVAWFLAASLLCAAAPNPSFLIAARLLQGVGGALLTPGSLAIIQSTLRPDDRGSGVGAWSGISGVASAIGPLIGGVLVEASWRWVFVINVPIGLVVLVLSRWIPETSDHDMAGKPVDVAGAALLTATLGAATYALGRRRV